MSNSHTEYVINTFQDFDKSVIKVRHSIHSKNPEKMAREVLIQYCHTKNKENTDEYTLGTTVCSNCKI